MRLSPCFAAILLASTGLARADGVSVRADNEKQTAACKSEPASVGGNHNVIVFSGACTGLQIRGEANDVTASLTPGALIDIEGNHNRVRYTAGRGAAARLHISGSDTGVTPQGNAPAPAADTATLSGDDQTLTLDCAGRAMTLQGTRMNVTLRGACTALTVRGEANMVHADFAPGAQVLVEGNGISLIYTTHGEGPPPAFSVRGMGSSVTRADGRQAAPVVASVAPHPIATSTVAPPPIATQPVTAVPVVSVPLLMHDLDGIVVQPGTLVKLPQAVFAGQGLAPAGETQLGRLASLIGQIRPSGLRLTGRDPADPASAAQRLALVRDWLKAHGVDAMPMQEATAADTIGVDVLMLR